MSELRLGEMWTGMSGEQTVGVPRSGDRRWRTKVLFQVISVQELLAFGSRNEGACRIFEAG